MPVHPKVAWKHLDLHTKIHPRYKFILWLAIQKRLAIVEGLQKFGITVLPDCCDQEDMELYATMLCVCDGCGGDVDANAKYGEIFGGPTTTEETQFDTLLSIEIQQDIEQEDQTCNTEEDIRDYGSDRWFEKLVRRRQKSEIDFTRTPEMLLKEDDSMPPK
ncbi:hypothetical protein KY290_011028 [Solanum tuberosum]|uniref:Reverse transcriptase zinc-binding domain-containing protein n=1 Tax=Solanum tuberosum TaxID=4113 RepID=A0ABQ7VTL2_SOLTU|nr:hypothetical protein KY289_013688 [Solanum tuberosum]KAH0717007.1 hypothetical protein KY285_013038 [Solanum tuberosum]KAH0771847.1 hypothetical protein KY290_015828 [Solanum tuberosum]KAH0773891.1 hypothetical protein KY290_011028 [Solanum tuberosum]